MTNPTLSELPFKIELNEWGKIEMSPASNLHGMLQTAIAFNLKLLCDGGKAFVECSIETTKNVKVADVVWASSSFYARNSSKTPYQEAPEIVVEVASPSKTIEELMTKSKRSLAMHTRGCHVFLHCSGKNNRIIVMSPLSQDDRSMNKTQFPLMIAVGKEPKGNVIKIS